MRAPPQLREAATSCGGRRRLLGLLRPWGVAEKCCFSGLSVAGDAGASRPRPSPEGRMALWTPVRGDWYWSEGPARGGRAGLAGVTAQGLRPFSLGAPRRGACEAPPIRHGNCRDTFPSGEGGFAPFHACARAGLPYGRPASPMLAPSALAAGGGDLLRRPTEITPAPPAIHRYSEP